MESGVGEVRMGGNGREFVFLGVGVPSVLFSFPIPLCIDISVEDRGDFSGDSFLSLTFLGCSLYHLIICLFGFFFLFIARSLWSNVIAQLIYFV